MKVIFMGTPDFAVPILEEIIKEGHETVAVVTQPDKQKGRGNAVVGTPVKQKALEYGIKVYQPLKVKEESFFSEMKQLNPDVIVVAAFGQILPKAVLDLPKYGCINVHASLLPKYRGAAPIQWSIIDGEVQTGVTTMYMDEGLDIGDILLQSVVVVDREETGGSLYHKLSAAGAPLLVETLRQLEEGRIIRIKQDAKMSSYAKMLDKALGEIHFEQSAVRIERLIRGLNPWPSAYTTINGKILKMWKADVLETNYPGNNGDIVQVTEDAFFVKTGDGTLVVKEVQLEGKKRMDAASFLRGISLAPAMHLGASEEEGNT